MASLQLKVMLNTAGLQTRWTSNSNFWTNITDYVRVPEGFQVRHGRSSERGKITPSTATLTLDNTDRRFDPTYTAGPYFGGLKVNTPISISVWDADLGDWCYLFRGFVISGFPVREQFNAVSTVTITCGDALALASHVAPYANAYEHVTVKDRLVSGSLNFKRDVWFPLNDAGPSTDAFGLKTIGISGAATKVDPLLDDGKASAMLASDSYWTHTDQSMMVTSDPLSTDMSLEMWVRMPATQANGCRFYQQVNATPVSPDFSKIFLMTAGTNIQFGSTFGTTTTLVSTPGGTQPVSLNDDKPHHIVVSCSGAASNWKIYVDGVSMPLIVQTFAITGTTTSAEARLGVSGPTSGDGVTISDFQLWKSYAMTQAEAVERYKAGSGLPNTLMSDLVKLAVMSMSDSGGSPKSVLRGQDAFGRMVSAPYRSYGKKTVRDLLQMYEDSEQGLIDTRPENGTSCIRFTDRRGFNSSGSPYLTFADNGSGSINYLGESFVSEFDPLDLENLSSVARLGAEPQVKRNEASIAEVGERTLDTFTDLLLTSDREAQAIADWRAYSYGTPKKRIKQLKVMPLDSSNVFTSQIIKKLTGVTPSDLVRVDRNRNGDLETVYGHVYGSEWNIVGGVLTVTLNISSVRYQPFKGWNTLTWGENWEV